MDKFCESKEYVDYDNYGTNRNSKALKETVDKPQISVSNTRLYDAYPNPASDNINIEFSVDDECDFKFYLVDELGREMSSNGFSGTVQRGRYIKTLSLNEFCSGLYYAVLEYNNKKDVQKIIIIR
jgi:hypothetical protein